MTAPRRSAARGERGPRPALHDVYRYVRTGKLAARREGGEWLVRRSDLQALAREPEAPVERGRRGTHGMSRAWAGW